MIRVGFTGTRRGVTEPQLAAVFAQFSKLRAKGAEWLDHGGCAGADREAHAIWRELGGRCHVHPGDAEQYAWALRYSGNGNEVEKVAPYLWRNGVIVVRVRVLVAAPGEAVETRRSGTWATVRAARRRGLSRVLCLPSGEVVHEAPAQGSLVL